MTDPIQKTDATKLPVEETLKLDLAAGSSEPFSDNLLDDADDFLAPSANARSSDDILHTYSLDNDLSADELDDMEEIDGDALLSEMDDIEAELLALRQQLEAETQSESHIEEDEALVEDAHDELLDTPSSHHNLTHEHETVVVEEQTNDGNTEPEELDSFAAFAEELFEAADTGDYGVNSQRFKPDDFDVASETEEIAPVQIDENELEVIDGSDLEALFNLSDEYTPTVANHNSFLADAAQLEEQEELPNLLPETEEFSLEEETYTAIEPMDNLVLEDDEPELSAQMAAALDDIELDLNAESESEPISNVPASSDAITLDDESPAQPVASAVSTPNTSTGLDLSDDGDDPMAWLTKMKNEMASKFDINIDQEAAALNNANLDHLYDDLEEFDDQQANLGENLNQLPEFDESQLAQETAASDDVISVDSLDDIMTFDDEPVVKRPMTTALTGKSVEEVLNLNVHTSETREINTDISLDDIWADNNPATVKVDLTAAPLDETELEVFDESTLFGSTTHAVAGENIDLELDFSANTLPETESIDLSNELVETEVVALADHSSATQSEDLPVQTTETATVDDVSETRHENDIDETIDTAETAVEQDVFDTEVDFTNIVAELPAEALEDVSTDLNDLERVAAEITDMEDFVPPKTKLMELMEAEQQANNWDEVTITDETVEMASTQEVELDLNANSDHDEMLSVDEAVALVEPATEPEPESHSVLETITETVTEWEHGAEEWAQGMAHAVKEKAEELEMRAEILAHEVGDALKHAEEWVEDFTDALADKAEELEMRAEILAHEVVDNAKEMLHLSSDADTEASSDVMADAEEISLDELDAMLQADAELDVAPQMMEADTLPETVAIEAEPIAETVVENVETVVETAPVVAAVDVAESVAPETSEESSVVPEVAAAAAVATVAATALSAEDVEADKRGWASRLKAGLTKSRNQMAKSLAGVFGGGKIDEDLYEELETTLLISDMGIEATEQLMKEVRNRVSLKGLKDGAELRAALKDAVYDLLKPLEKPLEIPNNGQPFVIMMAGINGAGKTTSIGKLAKYFQAQGKSVMLAAGDTFRAAAREQLQEWGARNGVTVISQASGDSAAVCFDAVESAKAKGIDVVLADTAGRLPTQLHLMEEIKKVKRVLQKAMPDAPHEIMVVLDANIGQNAINQVVAFDDALGVTGLIVTKLDGTAKGGVLAALASSRPIPVRYIGVGEGIDDLRPFDARAFVDALLDE